MATIDLIVKVGDLDDKDTGLKDGMVVGYIDSEEWGHQPPYSDHMRKVYGILRVDRSWLTHVKDGLKEKTASSGHSVMEPNGTVLKARSAYIDLSGLENDLGISGLESDLRSPGTVEILDGSALTTAIFKDSKNYTGSKKADLNTVASGSYTVGSGKNYANWAAAYADIANLTGDLTFTQQTAVTETTRPNTTIALGGYTLTSTCDYRHKGDPTRTDCLITGNQDTHGLTNNCSGTGASIMSYLYWKQNQAMSNNFHCIIPACVNATNTVTDLMIDKNGTLGTSICPDTATGGTTGILYIKNILAWDLSASSTQGHIYLYNVRANQAWVENCTVRGGIRGYYSTTNASTLINTVAFGCTTCYAGFASSTGRNTVSTDTSNENADFSTGTDNYTAATEAFMVLSTDDTSPQFMDIEPAGDLYVFAGYPNYQTRTECIKGRKVTNRFGTTSRGSSEVCPSPVVMSSMSARCGS